MKIENGKQTSTKKNKGFGGFIKDTFIISKNDTPQRKNSKIISIVALLLLVAALVFGGIMISNYLGDSNQEDPGSIITSSGASPDDVVDPEPGDEGDIPEKAPDEFDADGILLELSDLYKLNKDVIGWVNIPGTQLDYPVAKKSVGENPTAEEVKIANEYYLTKTLEHKHDPYGTPYVDYRATFANGYQSDNITIYGHNSKDGAFFETVKEYANIDFYKENPIVNFNTIYGSGEYKIIGHFTEFTDSVTAEKEGIEWFNYHDYVEMDEKLFNKFMTNLDARNFYNTGIDVEYGDSILTFSTCNDDIQGPVDTPYRDVLVARKVRPGEDSTVDVDKITENTDMIMPAGWIEKFGKENPYK